MNLQCFPILLLLMELGGGFLKHARGDPEDAATDAGRSAVNPSAELLPKRQGAEVVREDASIPFTASEQKKETSEEGRGEAGSYEECCVVRGRLHVDLSLSNNVELVARLALLLQRLMTEQEAPSSSPAAAAASAAGSAAAVTPSSHPLAGVERSSADASAVGAQTAGAAPPSAARGNIQLELSYHIFDMEPHPTSAPHCVTGDLGHFCAFPPEDTPRSTGERQQQVGGRAVVEEELLQLCLAEAARQNWFAGATTEEATAAGRAVEGSRAAATEGVAAGNGRQGKTSIKSTAPASHLQSSAPSMAGYSGSAGQHLKLLWDYLARWSCNCTTRKSSCNTGEEAAADAGRQKARTMRENLPEEPETKETLSPFQAACSRAQLERLSVPVAAFMKRCEKAAVDMLQHQVDNRLSVVPSLLVNGKPALGELTAESVLKTLCIVAQEQAAAAVSPGASLPRLPAVCRAPEVANSTTLAVKSFGVGANTQLIQDLDQSGAPGELEVAAHLLNTFSRSSEGVATQPVAPVRPGVDTEGRYHFVNRKALRFLRKRLMAKKGLTRQKEVPVASVEQELTAFSTGRGAPTPEAVPDEMSAAVVEKDRAASQEDEAQAPLPLALDGPPAGRPSVLPFKYNLSEERVGRPRRIALGRITLKQQSGGAVADSSTPASERSADIRSADAVSQREKIETTANLYPEGAAEDAISLGDAFKADRMSWHARLLVGLLILVAVIAWLLKKRDSAAFASPPRPPPESATHQRALLPGSDQQDTVTPVREA